MGLVKWGGGRAAPAMIGLAVLGMAACSRVPPVPAEPAPIEIPVVQTPAPEAAPKADRVLVIKHERLLELMRGGEILKSYPISLGSDPFGPKQTKGDGKTPEGFYLIDWRSVHSLYHLKLHVSYPEPEDVRRAEKAGQDPGGSIYIHGMPESFGHQDPVRFFRDWTDGCIAVGNVAIEEIWDTVPDGTILEIRP